jgi:hypothetical protein
MSFGAVYTQFLDDLLGTFPEYATAIQAARDSESAQANFNAVWKNHTAAVANQDASIFEGAGVEMVPGAPLTKALWKQCGAATRTAIWKYLSSLLLVSASSDSDGSEFWDISGFNAHMEEMMKHLKEMGGKESGSSGADTSSMFGDMGGIFEKLSGMAKTFGFDKFADLSGASAAGGFKIPERLFKGHIAKIAAEIAQEFKPEDFGLSPDMLESDNPGQVFTYLQELFSRRPEMLMTAAQRIAKKIQYKFQRGEIKRDDIIREAEELMKEFSENEMFSSMFGQLSEMMKSTDKQSGNEGSARLRAAQERLRRKQAEKTAANAPSNTLVVSPQAIAASEAAAAALLAQCAAEDAKKPAGGKKGGKK